MSPTTEQPKLPLELEREIFELAALASPSIATTLILVCRYACIWIEPLLYEEMLLPLDTNNSKPLARGLRNKLLKTTMTSKSPAFFARNVKRLTARVSSHFQDMDKMLRLCTGLSSLGIWSYYDLRATPELLTPLPLRRFTTDIEQFLSLPADSSDPSCTWNRELSHLELDLSLSTPFGRPTPAYTSFSEFTHLQHVGFFALSVGRVRELARAALVDCGALEVLFVVLKWDFSLSELLATDADWVMDSRVVVMKMYPNPSDAEHIKSWEDAVWLNRAIDLVQHRQKVWPAGLA